MSTIETTEVTPLPRGRRLRKMSWALILWSAGMLIWTIYTGNAAMDPSAIQECVADSDGLLTYSDCEAASEIGTGIGVIGNFITWFVGFIVLAIVWFMTRPPRQVVVRVVEPTDA